MGWPQGSDEVMPSQTAATRCAWLQAAGPRPTGSNRSLLLVPFWSETTIIYLPAIDGRFKQDKAINSPARLPRGRAKLCPSGHSPVAHTVLSQR